MRRRLLRLVFLGPVLSVALAGMLVLFSLRMARDTFRQATLVSHMSSVDLDACVADPARWGWHSGDISMFGYDRSGRSANPAAPPVEPELLARAQATGRVASKISSGVVIWVAPHPTPGRCAVLRGTSRNPEVIIAPRFQAVLGVATVGGMMLAAAGAYWFVLLPLRRRINEIAHVARAVGRPAFHPQPASPDALGNIAEVLTQSHTRIVEAREALEARNRALEEHLAGIAHDLRTPLSSMHLALESVAQGSEGDLLAEARRALADVVYLSSMVENLHQATRLRHDVAVASGQVELSDLVRRLEKRFSILGRHAGVEVGANTPEDEVWVACTPALAERAIANLVQNAIEHNASPGHVAIKLSIDSAARRFQLAVADDGPGLPDEMMASLQRDTFLTDEARPRGSGLGMLISGEVARRAGWSLTYEALSPGGLEVRMEGPLLAASYESVAGAAGASTEL